MSTAIQPAKSLEERITARLHESIGDLITDEDLKGIVERGIETALFKGRKEERRSQWGNHIDTYEKPSLVEELTAKLLTERMTAAVDKWLADNPEKIAAAIQHVMTMGVARAVDYSLDQRFGFLFSNAIQELQNRGVLPRQP